MMLYYLYIYVSFLCVCQCTFSLFFARTLYMYAMCLTSLRGSIGDRMVSITF